MRYAIIADIHANLTAFRAVLEHMERRGGVEEVWCLGDVVGYGPEPCQCIELLQKYKHVCVAGNHDWAVIEKVSTAQFNPDAALACQWTAQQLGRDETKYLEGIPVVIQREDFTLVHGSPREPIWEYLISVNIAKENFNYFKSRFCLVGHSHIPVIFRLDEAGECLYSQFMPEIGLALGKGRLIINPGGVGQPRDGNPRASYAIYDSETDILRMYRVPYDVGVTQEKMVKYNLPIRLIARLSQGI